MTTKRTQVGLHLDATMIRDIRKLCAKTGKPMTEFMREAIAARLELYGEACVPRRPGMSLKEALDAGMVVYTRAAKRAPNIPAPTSAVSFRDVMQKMNAAIAAKKLTKAKVDAALAAVGLKPDEVAPLVLPANAEKLAEFNRLIDGYITPSRVAWAR